MIDWAKGLTKEQEIKLAQLLEEEKQILPKNYIVSCGEQTLEIFGRLLPRNKFIKEREYGYTYYIEVNRELKVFSAFHCKISEKVEEK